MIVSKKITITLLLITACLSVTYAKNKKKKTPVVEEPVKIEKADHTWYYFSKDNYVKIDKPQNTPFIPQQPWTEARRISGIATTIDSEVPYNSAFATVNRLGVLCFENDKISLCKDISIFNDRTAGNIILLNNTPIFSVYKSAFFNDTIKAPEYSDTNSQHLFLIQFDPEAKICYPIINCNNITEDQNSEVIDFNWDGINWLCSIKSISDNKNSFSYVKWKSTVSLLELSPLSAKNSVSLENISQDEFRKSKEISDFKKAPERIKTLIAGFSDKKSFEIIVSSAGGASPKTYTNPFSSDADKPLKAKAILAKSWSAALFEDGTLFLEGALPGKHILRDGKPIAIRLPKLPAGFIYSDFTISGTTLYAAWEESSFYNTSRSGFLEVNLDSTLYSKLR